MLRLLRRERNLPIVQEGETAEAQEAKRSRILPLQQLRRRSKKPMKRLLLLPRLMGVTEGAIVVMGARETRRKKSRLLGVTKATDHRVARIAPLEMILDLLSLSKETRSVGHLRMSTTLAEKCLGATTLLLPEVSTEEEEEAEPSSRRELHTLLTEAEAMLPLTKLATASGTCLTTEETRTSTSRSMTGNRTAEILSTGNRIAGILTTENSMTSIPGQATTLLQGDQSDLPWVLP